MVVETSILQGISVTLVIMLTGGVPPKQIQIRKSPGIEACITDIVVLIGVPVLKDMVSQFDALEILHLFLKKLIFLYDLILNSVI